MDDPALEPTGADRPCWYSWMSTRIRMRTVT